MAGKVFDLEEPTPNKSLEALRQAAVGVRDVALGLILDALNVAGVEQRQDEIVSQLILDALDAQLRADEAQAVADQLILDALDAGLHNAEQDARDESQDEAIDLLILEVLGA